MLFSLVRATPKLYNEPFVSSVGPASSHAMPDWNATNIQGMNECFSLQLAKSCQNVGEARAWVVIDKCSLGLFAYEARL